MWFMFVIPFIMFFVIFFVVVVSMSRGHKTVDTMQTMVEDVAKKNIQSFFGQTNNPTDADRICEYCGSKVETNQRKCPSCGAGVNRTNKKGKNN